MRLKILAAIGLIAVGVAAIGIVVVGPSLGSSSAIQYITATAAVTNVTQSAVATGSIAASATYGLAFGRDPVIAGSSTSSSAGTGGGSSTWPVSSVSVHVGDNVTKGQVLAVADSATALQALAAAQSNLAISQARLASDQGGLTPLNKAMAQLSVTQAQQQLANARVSQSDTRYQNNLSIANATTALSQAKATLATDLAASPPVPAQQISQDRAAVTSATQQLTQTKAKASQSNSQAAQGVASASLQLTSAQQGYQSKTAAAPALTILSDQASVASAQTAVDTAQKTVNLAQIVAPAAGTITLINLIAGVDAPSGDAIDMQAGTMQVTASFAETDLPALKVGQAASIAITATNETATGKLTTINPVASTSGSSSVVTYSVVITLDKTPADVKSGMSASVSITTAQAANVLAVPAIALIGANGSYTVRVMAADGSISSVPVTIGLTTTQYAAITSGINAGDTVVIGTSSPRTSSASTTAGGLGGGFGGGFGGGTFNGGGTRNRTGAP